MRDTSEGPRSLSAFSEPSRIHTSTHRCTRPRYEPIGKSLLYNTSIATLQPIQSSLEQFPARPDPALPEGAPAFSNSPPRDACPLHAGGAHLGFWRRGCSEGKQL
eukprot:7468085-Alexandrium_andersonii.AAC.1